MANRSQRTDNKSKKSGQAAFLKIRKNSLSPFFLNLFHFPYRLKPVLSAAVKKTLKHENVKVPGEINLILIKDREIKKLNRKYRKHCTFPFL